ncbi:hypothetical protein OHA21_03990 [Actinoplanes sp. NBC_00393]|uniref:hypothetical protein n=1 Tax=Actinoplanes sp. NBC_00393 TaxID=2975953 RepID=UPI002E1D59ED
MPVVSSKAHRRAAALLAASVAMLFTAACGGSDSESTANTSSAQNGGGGNNAFAAYLSCLNENGVTITMPSGGPGGGPGGVRPSGAPEGGPDGSQPRAMPSGQPRPDGSAGPRGGGGFPGGGGFSKPEGVDDATWEKAQSACASVRPSMGAGRGNRDNGANAAYTNCLKENGVTGTADLDTTDATVQKAVETCAVLKPTAAASAAS